MGKVWDVLAPRNLELGPVSGGERSRRRTLAALEACPRRQWRRLARPRQGRAPAPTRCREDVLAELNEVLARIERDRRRAWCCAPAKPSGFIAGADIGEFRGMTDAAAIEAPAPGAMTSSIGSIGSPCRPSPSFTAIASAAASRSRSPATTASRSRMRGFGFPEVHARSASRARRHGAICRA